MDVLFVCKFNVGRSQMAEALFNRRTKRHHATSAGTDPYYYLKKHRGRMPLGDPVVRCMYDVGIDLSKNRIKPVRRSLVQHADMVVVLMAKARARKDLPQYIKTSKKFRLWELNDVSGKTSFNSAYERHSRNRDKISALVQRLVKELR